jgi:hypothetical protein
MAHLSFCDPLFVAQLGDFTDRDAGRLGKALPVLRQLAMPAHHVLRNHSLGELTEAVPAERKLDCP